ncbi:hypothetical protein, partial [Cupriavidus sp. CuC1]|uniref:hypothetical protein n=1 Tax=Cupriavidus sp. CuC1 TaxID=3373131 RepID=UPI0037D28384
MLGEHSPPLHVLPNGGGELGRRNGPGFGAFLQDRRLDFGLRHNTVNKFEFVLTFKPLQQQEELEGW